MDWEGDEAQGRKLLGDLAADLFLDAGLIVSVHIVDPSHLDRLRVSDSLFFQAVQREGLVVEG